MTPVVRFTSKVTLLYGEILLYPPMYVLPVKGLVATPRTFMEFTPVKLSAGEFVLPKLDAGVKFKLSWCSVGGSVFEITQLTPPPSTKLSPLKDRDGVTPPGVVSNCVQEVRVAALEILI